MKVGMGAARIDAHGLEGLAALMRIYDNFDKGETVRLLLAAGADAGARNRRGKTARDLAQKKRHEAVVQLLDEACAQGEPGGAAPSEGIPPQRPPATAVYTTL